MALVYVLHAPQTDHVVFFSAVPSQLELKRRCFKGRLEAAYMTSLKFFDKVKVGEGYFRVKNAGWRCFLDERNATSWVQQCVYARANNLLVMVYLNFQLAPAHISNSFRMVFKCFSLFLLMESK